MTKLQVAEKRHIAAKADLPQRVLCRSHNLRHEFAQQIDTLPHKGIPTFHGLTPMEIACGKGY